MAKQAWDNYDPQRTDFSGKGLNSCVNMMFLGEWDEYEKHPFYSGYRFQWTLNRDLEVNLSDKEMLLLSLLNDRVREIRKETAAVLICSWLRNIYLTRPEWWEF